MLLLISLCKSLPLYTSFGLKAQLILAQGNALGIASLQYWRPERATQFYASFSCPYRAPVMYAWLPRVLPWANMSWAFSPIPDKSVLRTAHRAQREMICLLNSR